ncbi:MFS transporter [Polymorphobacter sp.]|uniref:MFS transporter n=1 Tax=Polymorphobacter sp. TaxID=1909290 RepID=UPI003F6F3799
MDGSKTYRAEFARGWKTVAGGTVGMTFGISALPFYTLGVFVKPIQAQTGWSREEVQLGFAALMIGLLAFGWAWGMAVDRFGSRRVAMTSQVGLGVGLILLPSFSGSLNSWYMGWALVALLGAGTSPVTWTRCIIGWFDGARGAALGLALMGTGITAVLAPPLMTMVMETRDWSDGYRLLGASVILLALPLVALTFRDAPAVEAAGANLRGAGRAEALKDYRFWLIFAAVSCVAFAIGGLIPSLVPLLTDRGMAAGEAAGYAALVGVAVIVGRVSAGLLIDRFWAPGVGVVLLALPLGGCLLLLGGLPTPAMLAVAVVLIGLTAGAEFDLLAYLTGRYFGMRNYGFLYAIQTVGLLVTAGLAPAIFGRVFDTMGSYDPALMASAALFLFAPPLLLFLGRYPTRFD